MEKSLRQTKQQHVMSKLDRRNRAKQLRVNHHAAQLKAGSIFAGLDGAPRIVAVVPLCASVDAKKVMGMLNGSVDLDVSVEGDRSMLKVHVERFKQNMIYLPVVRNLLSVLDACRMADFVVWVLDATEEVDSVGETLLRAAQSQGISNVLAAAQVRNPLLCNPNSRLIKPESGIYRVTEKTSPDLGISQILHHTFLPSSRESQRTGLEAGMSKCSPCALHKLPQRHILEGRPKLDGGRRGELAIQQGGHWCQ